MKKTKKALASLAIAGMVLSMAPASVFAADATNRFAGAGRVETAIAIANNGWTASDNVIVVPADDANIVDALAAAPLAGQLDAPILVTYKNSLDPQVAQKIVDLKAKNVYAIGALSADVVNSLKAISGVTVEMLQGADRTETAAKVAAKLTGVKGSFVVAYNGIADAMSAASYAAANDYSILVANPDGTLPSSEAAYKGEKVYTVGGQVKLDGATALAGADRYATNDAVLNGLEFSYDKVYVANGQNPVDALAGAPLAAKTKSPIVLGDNYDVATGANDNLTASSQVIALGGTGAVPESVLSKVAYQAPATLAVESVSAINLKQVKVVFNKPVDKDSATNVANYTVNGSALGGSDIITLQDDNQTVLITLNTALSNNTDTSFVVGKILSADNKGQQSATYVTKVKYADSTVPTLVSASVTAKNKVRVVFSEPVNGPVAGDFVVDGGSYVISSVTNVPEKSAVDLVLGSDITAGAHTVKVVGNPTVTDFAGYKPLEQSISFNFAGDTVAPTVSVKSATETSVTLAFSEPVQNVNNSNVRFRHTYDNSSYQNTGDNIASIVPNTDNKEWTIDFGSSMPMAPGAVKLYIGYVSDSGTKIEDNFGNKLEATSLTVNVVQDTTAPTVSSVAYVDSTHVDVTFSEAVSGATTASNYVLKDADGNTISVSNAALQTGNTYRLTTATLTGGTYNLTVSGIKDTSLAANALATTTLSFTAPDKTAPNVASVVTNKAASTNADKLRVRFSEAMADTGLTDTSNYQLKLDGATTGTALPTGTTITKVDSKTVDIVFPSAVTGMDAGPNDVLVVSGNLQDLAGNKIGGFSVDAPITVDAVSVVADSIKALDKNTIEFRVNKMVSAVDASQFSEPTAAGISIASVTAANDTAKGQGIITVKLSGNLSTNVTGTPFDITANAGAITTDFGYNGSTIAADLIDENTTKDYIAPEVSSIVTGDADGDGQIDQIVITYTENIQQSSVTASDYTVEGYTISDVTVSGATATLKIKESGVVDSGATPKVTQVGSIADDSAQHNVLASKAATSATDGVAPKIASVRLVNSTTVEVTFNEAIASSSVAASAFTLATADSADTETIDSATLGADGKTVTVVASAANIATGDTITVSNAVTDVAGNLNATTTAQTL